MKPSNWLCFPHYNCQTGYKQCLNEQLMITVAPNPLETSMAVNKVYKFLSIIISFTSGLLQHGSIVFFH
jgi:hypothetical protein